MNKQYACQKTAVLSLLNSGLEQEAGLSVETVEINLNARQSPRAIWRLIQM